jgi:alkylation response protein AidB-like acyl-CoA dehydrogenase
MDFDLSKPQKLLKQSARDLLTRECKPERVRHLMSTDTAYDADLWRAVTDQGWTGIIIPEQFGGLGLTVVELAAIAEEMGRALLPGPLFSTIFASAALIHAGTDAQRRRWLEPIAAGEVRATVALGRELVYDAEIADVIFWVTADGLLEVEKRAPGLTIRRTPSMDETRKLYTLSFAAAPRAGMSAGARKAIDVATAALCAEMVGGMQWILDTTVDYAKTRQQFGKPIGAFQAVQHHCADMLLLTESSRSATYYAAWALTHDEDASPIAASMAKAYCSDAYREVGNKGIQVHGGIGFTWEHDLQLYYKRSKASETLFGDATFHRERLATLVVDEVAARSEPVKEEEAV